MDENENPQDNESSLIEIEVAEEEEIEVEESETEMDNDNPELISKQTPEETDEKINEEVPKKEYLEEEKEKVKEKRIEKEKEKEQEKENEKGNIDKPYSEIELKIIDIMNGSETINNLLNNNNKWDEKKKGLSLLNEYISKSSNKEKIITNFDVFFNYIQDILKNFKESNFIILKEGLECVCSLFIIIKMNNNDNSNMNKKYLNILITELNEKITESKLKSIYIKLIDLLMGIYGPNDIINCLIQIINKSNKISLLKEYAIFIKNYINSNDNNIKSLSAKDIIDFCIKIGNNTNQQLRKLSTEIICSLYNYIGEEYILYIKNNIKESYFKILEQEINKINKEKNNNSDNSILSKNFNEKKNSNEINTENKFINIDSKKEMKNKKRNDISKDITPVLLKYINFGKWNEKKEGIEFIHKILNRNNNHVLINGLNDLIELIITKLIDSNKNLVRLIIELLSHLIESLGIQLKPYTKNIITPLLSNLTDKNNILRQECVSCINKWISVIQNFEVIFTLIPSLLLNDNYDMRNELLNLLINNINSIKKENIYLCHFEDLITSLLNCLQDKSSNIRNSTEKFIELSMKIIPREDYIKKTNQFKPAIAENLDSIINNIYGYKDNNNENTNRERNASKKRYNNFFSPQKLRNNDERNLSVSRKDLLKRKRISQSIGKDLNKNSFFIDDNKEEKENKELTIKNENKKRKIFQMRTCKENLNSINRRNKMNLSSLNNTIENIDKKKKKIKLNINNNTNNTTNTNIHNKSISNINNSIVDSNTSNSQININNINNPPVKEKNKIQTMSSIPNIAKRVNKFYNNTKKPRGISNIKNKFNNKKNNNSKMNISNYKNNFNEMMQDIRNEDKSKPSKRNRFFSPIGARKASVKAKNSFQLNDNSFNNNSENLFYKRMISHNFSKKINSDTASSINNELNYNKLDNDFKANLFLPYYRIKKDQKEKRIDEDRKINYYFEIQNFDQIPKIKELMKSIFTPEFVETIFGDNTISVISCINKIKNYIENDKDKDNILNIEDNLDILLKVIGYKLANNKSSSLIMGTLEFFNSLLLAYQNNKIVLNEIESNIILNILVDKLINNTNTIKETANNLLWSIVNMIGDELSLLIIIHLIEYKNTKTKIETINIIIKLYTNLLGKNQYNFDNWKIKVIKNIVSLYFEGDHNNKNKLLFIIRDLYSSFKDEIWKHCKNISSKNKDELLKRIKENQNDNNKYNFDNDYQTYTKKSNDNINCDYIFSNIRNRNREEIQTTRSRKDISKKKEQIQSKNIGMKKIKTNIVYDNKNKKVFENRKNLKINDNNLNESHSRINSNLTDMKKSNVLKSKDIYNNDNSKSNKNVIKYSHKRDSSIKKNLFLKHINTVQNIHDEPKYDNIINQATNKLVMMNSNNDNNTNNNEEKNMNQKLDKKKLSQSTVIINNNYNFIKIKNNEDAPIKKREKSINNKKKQKSNDVNSINNDNFDQKSNNNNNNDGINIIHSNRNKDMQKKKILVNCTKKEKFLEIKRILESLCSGDKTDMTELILKIHNILYTNYKKNESILINHCDYIFNKLIQAINNLLDEKKIYTNYIKYISNVLCKICKLGDLLSKISIETQNNLIFLTIKTVSLLDDNENDNNYYYNNNNEENSVITKCFNSIMLRIIDYGDVNNNINLLMNFEKKYRKTNKYIVNYVSKCLIIIIKNIKKIYDIIDIGIVIENIYSLLEDLLSNNSTIKINNKEDQIIMIIIKNMLNQLIIYRGDYELIECINIFHNSKRMKKSIFDYQNNDNVKNWLVQYIDRIKSHRDKLSEKGDDEENYINKNINNINNEY